jgi:hypothetical protein
LMPFPRIRMNPDPWHCGHVDFDMDFNSFLRLLCNRVCRLTSGSYHQNAVGDAKPSMVRTRSANILPTMPGLLLRFIRDSPRIRAFDSFREKYVKGSHRRVKAKGTPPRGLAARLA